MDYILEKKNIPGPINEGEHKTGPQFLLFWQRMGFLNHPLPLKNDTVPPKFKQHATDSVLYQLPPLTLIKFVVKMCQLLLKQRYLLYSTEILPPFLFNRRGGEKANEQITY
jgi:hypothetical protein